MKRTPLILIAIIALYVVGLATGLLQGVAAGLVVAAILIGIICYLTDWRQSQRRST